MLHIDFETRSRVNLLTDGAYNYATDPSTDVLMMAWAFDNEPVELWLPFDNHSVAKPRGKWEMMGFPERIVHYINCNGTIKAFNAQFERLMFWYIICPDLCVPEPALEQFYCVAAQARANNLPGNLDDCARACGAEHTKDRRGKELIKLFCIERGEGGFNDEHSHPEEWAEFCGYCISDTEAERDIDNYMRPMTDFELDDYHINERINDRGMMIDRDLAVAAVRYADEEQRNLVESIDALTNGDVQKARGKFITQWVYDHIPEDCRTHMHVYKGGERRLTFDKNARARLMDESEIEPTVSEVIEASDFAQASSTAKFAAMAHRADPEDDRVRGSFIFNGASGTGRYSARGLQPHNMPRKNFKEPTVSTIKRLMLVGARPEAMRLASEDNIMQTLKGMLRYAIMAAPGHTFVAGDWAQIEGRVCPWLANSPLAEQKLAVYADPDRDVYCETAADILGRDSVDRDDPVRQGYGKVPELSLQFGGGPNAFHGMARNYDVNLPRSDIETIVKRWRMNNPWAQPFWYQLFNAALKATQNPGTPVQAGRISYQFQDDFLGGTLWCLLPSGRLLAYPQCRAEWRENRFGEMAWVMSYAKAAWKPKADDKEWPRAYLWPGLFCENVTQAVAADILRELLCYLDSIDAPVVGHTHDEALLEVLLAEAEYWRKVVLGAMVVGSDWTEGLPLHADIWIGPRYKK